MRGNEADNRSGPVEEDMPLQLRVWRIERAGWYALLLLVMLALLGLFSKGPLSDATVTGSLGHLQVYDQRQWRRLLQRVASRRGGGRRALDGHGDGPRRQYVGVLQVDPDQAGHRRGWHQR